MIKKAELKLTQEWDKTFPKSEDVDHSKVTFVNRYGITLAADMYVPKNAQGRLPAIAVSGPFGAVKEQCSGLYAQAMAQRGFLTVAFDPSDESVMKDGKVDISLVNAIAFDPYTHGYYKVTERVGDAFRDGLKIK